MEFYRFIAKGFGIEEPFDSKERFLEIFREFLIQNEARKKKVLLIVDEAQRLNSELLEEIRLLSNIEKDYTKLLNIFFVGQNEFNDIILEQRNRPLRQRITINYNIEALEDHEIADYLQFRLSVAGCDRQLFDAEAVEEVYRYSEGYPRLINIICDHALLTAFVQGEPVVTGAIVRECAEELKIESVRPMDELDLHSGGGYGGPPAAATAPPVFVTAPPSDRARMDYMIYGVIILLLLFIAGYMMLSTPQRIARIIGLEGAAPVRTEDGTTGRSAPERPVTLPAAGPDGTAPETSGAEAGPGAAAAPGETAGGQGRIQVESLAEAATEPTASPRVPAELPDEPLRIFFQSNSNELTPEDYGVLERTASILEDNPEVALDIRGYTDILGSLSYNLKISEFRANIVKTFLVGKGLSATRIRTFGMGPENPIADNATFEGRQRNRRVELEFVR
jgi:general secretion pathway protein A